MSNNSELKNLVKESDGSVEKINEYTSSIISTMNNNLHLKYLVKESDGSLKELHDYTSSLIGRDAVYARQLCHYVIIGSTQYRLSWNEMVDGEEILYLENQGQDIPFSDGYVNLDINKIIIEFRPYNESGFMPLVAEKKGLPNHFEVIRYLLKDTIEIEGIGLRDVDSFEYDVARQLYVFYFVPTEEDVERYKLN